MAVDVFWWFDLLREPATDLFHQIDKSPQEPVDAHFRAVNYSKWELYPEPYDKQPSA